MAKQQTTNELLNEQMLLLEAQRAYESEMSRSFTSLLKGLGEERKIRKEILSIEREISNIEKILKENKFKGVALDQEDKKLLKEKKKQYQDIATRSKAIVDGLNKQKVAQEAILNSGKQQLNNAYEYSKVLSKDILKHLDSQDGLMKQMNLQFGVSNQLSGQFSKNIIMAAEDVARLGISTSDLVKIQNTYVDITGKLSPLSKQNLKDISAIAAGTGIGAENASKMVAEFESLGLGVNDSRKIVEDLSNSSGNFGVSLSKTLKGVSENIGKLNTYNFKGGIKGLIDMVKMSERFKIDMTGTFNAMEKSRTLEGSLEMASQLMVMGGEFAKTDPFSLMANSRNNQKQFQSDLNKMLGGLATFNKQTKEFEIGAYDIDRLRSVAEATGQDFTKLEEQAKRISQINLAKKSIFAGSKEDKEFIATIAQANGKGGFEISVGNGVKDLSKLTNADIAMFKQQKKTLDARAIDAQTFDDTMTNLVLELKSTLLPLLKYTNELLVGFRGLIDGARSVLGGSFGWAAKTLTAITLASSVFGTAFLALKPLIGGLSSIGSMFKGSDSKGGSNMGNVPSSDITGPNGASPAGTTANYARAASIAAIGVAAVGIGYGIKLAAEGFTGLGDSMAKMDIETKNRLLGAMAITFGGLRAVIGGLRAVILAAGVAGTTALPGLLGIATVAASIGAAGAGVGYLVDKINSFKNPEAKMIDGIKSIDFTPMKLAFAEGNKFLRSDSSNLDKLKNQLEDLRVNFNLGVDNLTKELKTLNDKGIVARFDKSEASINITIENIIDGEKIVSKNSRTVAIEISNTKKGKSAFSF